jgi:hypothetical protein
MVSKFKCGKLSFEDCQKTFIDNVVENITKKKGETFHSKEINRKLIDIVEKFLVKNKVICYGGIAINNILPKKDQFYGPEEFPDYDFFSTDAMKMAKELCDEYYANGFIDVEAKSGVHFGTYKVYVNFIQVADITQMNKVVFNKLYEESLIKNGIRYAPPNYLRMSMYLELSRPEGDVSRWSKVNERLMLLNKHYPFLSKQEVQKCRELLNDEMEQSIVNIVKQVGLEEGVIFFGQLIVPEYLKKVSRLKALKKYKMLTHKMYKGSVSYMIHDEPKMIVDEIKDRMVKLDEIRSKDITVVKTEKIQDLIPEGYTLYHKDTIMARVYEPIACHSYNILKKKGFPDMKIASIETILSFYIAFFYADIEDDGRELLCMSEMFYQIIETHKLVNKGLLSRYSITCYGNQRTIYDMRREKAYKFYKLKNKKRTKEYKQWFFKYSPFLERSRQIRDIELAL